MVYKKLLFWKTANFHLFFAFTDMSDKSTFKNPEIPVNITIQKLYT